MTRAEAKKILKRIVNTSNELTHPVLLNTEMEAIKVAIEALKAQPKFTRITIDIDERWLNRKFDVFKDRLYLNEKTMIIYVPFVSFELIAQRGGTIKRIGEEE